MACGWSVSVNIMEARNHCGLAIHLPLLWTSFLWICSCEELFLLNEFLVKNVHCPHISNIISSYCVLSCGTE